MSNPLDVFGGVVGGTERNKLTFPSNRRKAPVCKQRTQGTPVLCSLPGSDAERLPRPSRAVRGLVSAHIHQASTEPKTSGGVTIQECALLGRDRSTQIVHSVAWGSFWLPSHAKMQNIESGLECGGWDGGVRSGWTCGDAGSMSPGPGAVPRTNTLSSPNPPASLDGRRSEPLNRRATCRFPHPSIRGISWRECIVLHDIEQHMQCAQHEIAQCLTMPVRHSQLIDH
jgi:hypothetical protein